MLVYVVHVCVCVCVIVCTLKANEYSTMFRIKLSQNIPSLVYMYQQLALSMKCIASIYGFKIIYIHDILRQNI